MKFQEFWLQFHRLTFELQVRLWLQNQVLFSINSSAHLVAFRWDNARSPLVLKLFDSIWPISASSIFWHKRIAGPIEIANLGLKQALFPFLHQLGAFLNLVHRNLRHVDKSLFLVFGHRLQLWHNLTFSHFSLIKMRQYGVQENVGPWHI